MTTPALQQKFEAAIQLHIQQAVAPPWRAYRRRLRQPRPQST
jgi:hypothetical protein